LLPISEVEFNNFGNITLSIGCFIISTNELLIHGATYLKFKLININNINYTFWINNYEYINFQ